MAPQDGSSIDFQQEDLEITADDLRMESSSQLLAEALSHYLERPRTETPSRLRPTVGKSLHGHPQVSEWSHSHVAERSVYSDKVRTYVVKVAEGLNPGEPFGTVRRAGYAAPMRSRPMTLPDNVSTHYGFSSGWLTSRPSSQEATRRRCLTPALSRFPALKNTGLRPAKTDLEVVEAADRAVAWGLNQVHPSREREPGFMNEQPWLSGALPKDTLSRQPGGLHDPDDEDVYERRREVASTPQGSTPPKQASPRSKSPVDHSASSRSRLSKKFHKAGSLAASTAMAGKRKPEEKLKQVKSKMASRMSRQVSAKDPMDAILTHKLKMGEDGQSTVKAKAEKKRNAMNQHSVLWKIPLKDTKEDRMSKVSAARRAKHESGLDGGVGYKDRVNRYEVEIAQECFLRYFPAKTNNKWNLEKVLEALADFGIKAQNRTEKLALGTVLKEHEEERRDLGFNHFCNMIEGARLKLRAARSMSVFQAWKYVDYEDVGMLDASSIKRLLEHMNLAFKPGSIERHYVETLVSDCTTDPATGLVAFGEVEYLVSAVREYMVQGRRQREREMQVRFHISPLIFKEFRSQIINFYDYFHEFDDDGSGSLDADEALNLLNLFGCIASNAGPSKREAAQTVVESTIRTSPDNSMTFVDFLNVVKTFRALEMEEKMDEVQTLFNQYDHDRSGDLSLKEICIILMDLHMQPKSLLEQEAISQLIEEADADGSGQLNVHELLFLVQRITERVAEMHRQDQIMKAEAMGFTRKQANTLRQAFDTLDSTGDGSLGVHEVEVAVGLMEWHVSSAKLSRIIDEVDTDGTGQLDFIGFLSLMRRVDEEVNHVSPSHAQPNSTGRVGTLNTSLAADDAWTGTSEPAPERPKRRAAMSQVGMNVRNR